MVYTNKTETRVFVNCNCGCGDGVEIIVDKDKEDYFCSMQIVSSKWYSEQGGFWDAFAKKLKKIWRVIRGKDYYYCDAVMKIDEFNE